MEREKVNGRKITSLVVRATPFVGIAIGKISMAHFNPALR